MGESATLATNEPLPESDDPLNRVPQSFERYIYDQMYQKDQRELDLSQYADGSIIEVVPADKFGAPMYAMFYEVEQEGRQEAIVINTEKVVAFGKRVCRATEDTFFVEWAPMIRDADLGMATADETQNFIGIESSPEPSGEAKGKAFDLAIEHGAVGLDFPLYDQSLMS